MTKNMNSSYMQGKSTSGLIFGVIVALLVAGLVYFSGEKKEEAVSRTSREVALACTTDMATEFHIHPEIRIFIKGEEVLIPKNIGVTKDCMNAIHTHDDMPVVHVESPVPKDFTLGDFFAVWKKEFSKDQLLEDKADAGHRVKVTVNGEEVDTYENTILRDKDKIVISYE